MGILVLLALIVLVLFVLHQRGKRVAQQLGIDSETTSLEEAARVRYEQRRIAEKTQALVKRDIGTYAEFLAETKNPGSNPKLTERARSLAHPATVAAACSRFSIRGTTRLATASR